MHLRNKYEDAPPKYFNVKSEFYELRVRPLAADDAESVPPPDGETVKDDESEPP